jgi:hypothetical protein
MRMAIRLDGQRPRLTDDVCSGDRRVDEYRCLCICSSRAGYAPGGIERTHRVSRTTHNFTAALIGDSALMGSYFLKEEVNVLGRLGCAACLLGSVLLVLHAPGDKDIQTIDEILHLAIQPCRQSFPSLRCQPANVSPVFLIYCACVTILASYIIWKVAPVQGRTNPLVYISICSSVGSVSVMSVKAFGIAVKLTAGGDNQFTHASTYVFALVLVVTTLTQMNYLNKAMGQFPASL